MRKKNRGAAALLAGLLALSLTACGDAAAPEEAPAGVAVQAQEVTAGTISTENKVSGKVSADNESTIFIATSAKCTAVYAHAGPGQHPGVLQRGGDQLFLRRPELSGPVRRL